MNRISSKRPGMLFSHGAPGLFSGKPHQLRGCHSVVVKIICKSFILLFFLLTSCATREPAVPELTDVSAEVSEISRDEPEDQAVEKTQDPEPVAPEQVTESEAVPPPVQVTVRTAVLPVRPLTPVNTRTPYLHRLQSFPQLDSERDLSFRIFPLHARIQAAEDGKLIELASISRIRDTAHYSTNAGAVLISAPGYQPLIVNLERNPDEVEAKLERLGLPLVKVDEITTDYQPKSVRFAADGESVFVANLGDFTAITQFRSAPLSKIRSFEVPEEYRKDSGFVETLILPGLNEIWLSQMNRNMIHIFDIESGDYLAGIELSGVWPKVLTATQDETRVYVSCWDSKSIVEIDVLTRREIRSFHTSGTPRGLVLSPDEKSLLATMFSSSGIDRIDLETGEIRATYEASPGRNIAMRHIVYDELRGEYYITAMGARRVYRLSENGEWSGWWDVGEKPNTCAISPDGSRLFVSCRGPNNPDTGYLQKGYEFGKIYIINLNSGTVEGWIWGRDQPTGLDVSPDGQYLAFSDFLSHRLELYRINRFSQPAQRSGR